MDPELDKLLVLVQALVDRLENWGTCGMPSEKEAERTASGFASFARELHASVRSKYAAILATWHSISPGLSGYMAGEFAQRRR